MHGLVQNAPSLICTLVFDVSCRGFKLQIKLWQSNRDFCTQVHVPDLFLNPITITYLCFLLHTRGGGVTSPEKHKGVKKNSHQPVNWGFRHDVNKKKGNLRLQLFAVLIALRLNETMAVIDGKLINWSFISNV